LVLSVMAVPAVGAALPVVPPSFNQEGFSVVGLGLRHPIYSFRGAGFIGWSPDGTYIAYERSGRYQPTAPQRRGVWIASPTGAHARLIAPGRAYTPAYGSDAWSPDGTWLALMRENGSDVPSTLVLAKASGGDVLDTGNDIAAIGAWDRAGMRLLSWGPGPSFSEIGALQVTDATTGQTRAVASPVSLGSTAWSPDGAWLAVDLQDSPEGIGVIDPATGTTRRLLVGHVDQVIRWSDTDTVVYERSGIIMSASVGTGAQSTIGRAWPIGGSWRLGGGPSFVATRGMYLSLPVRTGPFVRDFTTIWTLASPNGKRTPFARCPGLSYAAGAFFSPQGSAVALQCFQHMG